MELGFVVGILIFMYFFFEVERKREKLLPLKKKIYHLNQIFKNKDFSFIENYIWNGGYVEYFTYWKQDPSMNDMFFGIKFKIIKKYMINESYKNLVDELKIKESPLKTKQQIIFPLLFIYILSFLIYQFKHYS